MSLKERLTQLLLLEGAEPVGLSEQGISSAAADAAQGQDIGASMLRLMAGEAGEPEQLATMQQAYETWMNWVCSELDEVGDENDDTQMSMYEALSLAESKKALRLYERKFSADQRQAAAKSGAALPDGSFPIENAADLKNAVRLAGNGNAPKAEVVAHIKKRAKALGQSDPYAKAKESEEVEIPDNATWLSESVTVPLLEKAVREDGTIPVKIIQPGWGTSGYYSETVIKRDGPKAFNVGTKMYWDHPTESERAERPERSLDELAAEIVSVPTYMSSGPEGPGLYADAKVFEAYKSSVDELAPHIGVSINAPGIASRGKAEGREGIVVESILPTKLNSVDFVTIAGAGGQVLPLFESARHKGVAPKEEHETGEEMELTEAAKAEVQQLIEAATEPLKAENSRLKETIVLRDAKDFVLGQLRAVDLPDITKVRLAESLSKNPPVKDGLLDQEAFATVITEAVKAEAKYLSEATGGFRIQGMGSGSTLSGGPEESDEDVHKGLSAGFARLGLTESAASKAATGRSN